jgi:hypothetical protein
MKKYLSCLILLLSVFILSSYKVNATDTVEVNIKVGQIKNISVADTIGKGSKLSYIVNSVSTINSTSKKANSYRLVAGVTLSSNRLVVNGLYKGTQSVMVGYTKKNGDTREFSLVMTVRGSQLSKDKNGLASIYGTSSFKTKKFNYIDCYFDFNLTGKKITGMFINVPALKNVSSKKLKPSIKVNFYDKNKKLVVAYKSTDSANWNVKVSPKKSYLNYTHVFSPESLGISQSKWSKIKYYKIVS